MNALLERLKNELAERPAHRTIEMRWNCRQVLVALGEARAAPMLEQLFADVQARVATMVDAPDREGLIQAVPEFRLVVTAYRGGQRHLPQPQ